MTPELRDRARTLGLDKLSDEHLLQLERAAQMIGAQLRRLPRDLPPTQELALIFRAKGESA
jgi:hypothetical protein